MSLTPVREALPLIDGGADMLDALGARIRAGNGKVVGELYQAAWHPLLEDLGAAARSGRHVDVLVNQHISEPWLSIDEPAMRQLHLDGVVFAPYDRAHPGSELWGHAKHWTFEDSGKPLETWLSNIAWGKESLGRNELTPVVFGERAAAARELTWSAMSDDTDRMRRAWQAAGTVGIIGTDARAGVFTLGDSIHATIGDARQGERLLVVTKGIDDPATTARIVAAHQRGADVQVYVRDLAPVDAEMLQRAGVPTRVVGHTFPGWRINYVAGPRQATLGTSFLWRQMMSDPRFVRSRDTGLLLAGEARAMVDRHVTQAMRAAGEGVDIASARAQGILKGTNSLQGEMTFDEARAAGYLPAG